MEASLSVPRSPAKVQLHGRGSAAGSTGLPMASPPRPPASPKLVPTSPLRTLDLTPSRLGHGSAGAAWGRHQSRTAGASVITHAMAKINLFGGNEPLPGDEGSREAGPEQHQLEQQVGGLAPSACRADAADHVHGLAGDAEVEEEHQHRHVSSQQQDMERQHERWRESGAPEPPSLDEIEQGSPRQQPSALAAVAAGAQHVAAAVLRAGASAMAAAGASSGSGSASNSPRRLGSAAAAVAVGSPSQAQPESPKRSPSPAPQVANISVEPGSPRVVDGSSQRQPAPSPGPQGNGSCNSGSGAAEPGSPGLKRGLAGLAGLAGGAAASASSGLQALLVGRLGEEGPGMMGAPDTEEALAQAMAMRDALQLVGYLTSHDDGMVQGALVMVVDYLARKRLSADDLVRAGVLPVLSTLISAQPSDTTTLALEALCSLLGPELSLEHGHALAPLVPKLLSALEASVSSTPTGPAPPPHSASSSVAGSRSARQLRFGEDEMEDAGREESLGALAAAVPLPMRHLLRGTPPPPTPASASGGSGSPSGPSQQDWQRLPAAFFAASAVVRLARFPVPASLLVQGGAVALLTSALTAQPTSMLPHVSLFALFKLLRVGSHADNLLALMRAGGAHALISIMASTGGAPAGAGTGHASAELAGAGVASLPPGGAASASDGSAARDMASSVLLDLALLPDAPAHAAEKGLVKPLVQLLSSARDPVARMYALLVLARLANHSSAVQMDAVREGAVAPLATMIRGGSEDEQLHAARLMAILAQSIPTHEALRAGPVMDALLGALSSPSPTVAEHAASVFAIMANNPDTHFQIVGWGAVPLLVALLGPAPGSTRAASPGVEGAPSTPSSSAAARGGVPSSSPKAQTYVLATLLLLAMHEPRHADVVCRAGAVPRLVGLVRGDAAPGGGPPSPAHTSTAAASVREYAAAVLSCLSRTVDVQVEIIAAGGIPALVRLLAAGAAAGAVGSEAQGHAAEALVQLAAVDSHRKRLIVRASEILESLTGLLRSPSAPSRYWGATLLQMLCQDDAVLVEVLEMGAAQEQVVQLLLNQDPGLAGDARRAQVQAAWLVARMCESPEVGHSLAAAGVVRPLVTMLGAGMASAYRGMGGGVPLVPGAAPPDAMSFPGQVPSSSGSGAAGGATNFYASLGGSSAGSGVPAGAGAGPGAQGQGGQGQQGRSTQRPMRIEALDHNANAAATAALLALARTSSAVRTEIDREMLFQEVWLGRRVRLEGLSAPATA